MSLNIVSYVMYGNHGLSTYMHPMHYFLCTLDQYVEFTGKDFFCIRQVSTSNRSLTTATNTNMLRVTFTNLSQYAVFTEAKLIVMKTFVKGLNNQMSLSNVDFVAFPRRPQLGRRLDQLTVNVNFTVEYANHQVTKYVGYTLTFTNNTTNTARAAATSSIAVIIICYLWHYCFG